ncbi:MULTISPECIES: MmgE/PrpD family protein [unclassified Ruegeria]|uniref:MmgE/PrpD family protein n=1 Tax=unclassified Ruegeria TaxID=2625375 RepID=UPI001490959F|nr:MULTISPECIES: MmgE/PrpD family protein [unclassified Ruegeria]NOD90640.1 hypothetical protein [Ruegeria sp. HKCCD4318]NOE15857.1 hypothetical protein [Ruegeria sp. HKCCD4318-2]NOG07869.1 MmgE/PrpD family protein [Ruegeria sp. HKCCD4315]
MTAISRLAQFAVHAVPPPDLRKVIAPAIADCFGCILAGSTSEVVMRATRALGGFGAGPCPLFGTNQTLSALFAAQINAIAGHAWDLDDWEEPGNSHPTVVLLPALLAASTFRRTTGAELLAAYAVGTEIIMRLGEAVSLDHYARGFHSTATLGTIGVAGAVSRLLALSADQTAHALSLATSTASGYTLQFGSNTKPLQAGWAARNGLEAAVLAAQGVTGQPHVLDHARGFAGLQGNYDPSVFNAAMGKMGSPWALGEYGLVLKPWPSCGYTHRLMTAAINLRPAVNGRFGGITAIDTRLPDFHAEILPFNHPKSRAEALFSIPACVGQILASGNLTLSDSEDAFWKSPAVSRLIQLTRVTAEPARNSNLNYDPDQPDLLRIEFNDGSAVSEACAFPLGASQNPMTNAQLAAKYTALTGQPERAFNGLLAWPDAQDSATLFKGYSNEPA